MDEGEFTVEVAEVAEEAEVPEAEEAAPEAEAEAKVAAVSENFMELYELAGGWLGCHVTLNADNTFTVAYDYNAENAGLVLDSGSWEQVSDTEIVLHSDSGTDISVTLADDVWSCEVTEPNTQTVCHPQGA